MIILCKMVTQHTLLIGVLKEVFEDWLDKSQTVAWKTSRLKSLILSVGNLKNKVHPNNPHTLDELKHTCESIPSIRISELETNLAQCFRKFKNRKDPFWTSTAMVCTFKQLIYFKKYTKSIFHCYSTKLL
jgi:hypothetical protein